MAKDWDRLLEIFFKKSDYRTSLWNRIFTIKKIIDNFDQEIENFIQVFPKEMIDKLENPISNKVVSFAS